MRDERGGHTSGHTGPGPRQERETVAKTTGRKTKLSPDLQKRLLDAMAAGNYIHTACAAVGIGESTYFKWLERGRAGESPYREFVEALTRVGPAVNSEWTPALIGVALWAAWIVVAGLRRSAMR